MPGGARAEKNLATKGTAGSKTGKTTEDRCSGALLRMAMRKGARAIRGEPP